MWTQHHVAVVAGFVLGLILVLRLLQQRQRPSVTLAWLMGMLLVPYIGVPLFVLFSGRKLRSHMQRKAPPLTESRPDAALALSGVPRLLAGEGCAAPRDGNQIELLTSGEVAFERLFEELEGARDSIQVSTFLLAADSVGQRLVETLSRKAREGVDVRLLVDALGCLSTRGRFLDPLRRAGGKVGVFLPVTPLHRRWSANLRNHRKLALIDGALAWTGGMNFALEYMGPEPDPGRWIDVSALVRGPVVGDLESVFRGDWEFATKERLPAPERPAVAAGPESVQVLASGPDVAIDRLSDAILAMTSQARERVAIVTPYFIPDEPLLKALLIQARMGRRVLLVLPERSNHRLADLARTRFLQRLTEAGGEVRLVPQRMVHAKALLFDDDTAVFGSANVDLRSLYLNFEVSLVLRDGPGLRSLSSWIDGLAESGRVFEDSEPRLLTRILADASSLVAPLL